MSAASASGAAGKRGDSDRSRSATSSGSSGTARFGTRPSSASQAKVPRSTTTASALNGTRSSAPIASPPPIAHCRPPAFGLAASCARQRSRRCVHLRTRRARSLVISSVSRAVCALRQQAWSSCRASSFPCWPWSIFALRAEEPPPRATRRRVHRRRSRGASGAGVRRRDAAIAARRRDRPRDLSWRERRRDARLPRDPFRRAAGGRLAVASSAEAACTTELYDATRPGAMCRQVDDRGELRGIRRIALSLDVWTPAASASERHPVMVWIHGGDNVIGSAEGDFAGEPVYAGRRLQSARRRWSS